MPSPAEITQFLRQWSDGDEQALEKLTPLLLMRRILVDSARSRKYAKRGGGARPVSLDEVPAVSHGRDEDILALDEALERLAAVDPRKAQVVELRCFGGLSLEETASVLRVTSRTVLREWDVAKGWLHQEMSGGRAK